MLKLTHLIREYRNAKEGAPPHPPLRLKPIWFRQLFRKNKEQWFLRKKEQLNLMLTFRWNDKHQWELRLRKSTFSAVRAYPSRSLLSFTYSWVHYEAHTGPYNAVYLRCLLCIVNTKGGLFFCIECWRGTVNQIRVRSWKLSINM